MSHFLAWQTPRGKVLCTLLLAALLLGGCRTKSPVQSGLPPPPPLPPVKEVPGYLTAPMGGPMKDSHGRCWRTADWRPMLAIEECDPGIFRERRAAELALALAAVAPVVAAADPAPDAQANTGAADPGNAATAAVAVVPAPIGAPMTTPGVSAEIAPGYITKPVVLNTDAAFFFGKDKLTAAGKDAVENLAAYIKLWGIEEVQVEVVGHTDRIGNARDNLALSKRRADAVKEVLVGAGVPAASISATGVGSTQPLTAPDACPDDIERCELITCLAPDRRVEVGLKGTRKAPVR